MANLSALPASLAANLRSRHLAGLDGLRAIAVSLVILMHGGLPWVPAGTGVLLFFVLSGFLITWLLLVEDDRTDTVSLRGFYLRRTLRIFPAFYAYAAFTLLLTFFRHRDVLWPQAIAALLYVSNYWQAIHGDPNTGFSHTWSLSVEEQFYLLWPALFLTLRANRARMARVLAAGIVVVCIHRLLMGLVYHVNQGWIYEAFDTRADSLMAGCLLAVALRQGIGTRFIRGICWSSAAPLVTLALLGISGAFEYKYGSNYRDTFGLPLNNLLSVMLITQALCFTESATGRWLAQPWMRYLGRISYSLYLWQQFVVAAFDRVLMPYGTVVSLTVKFAVTVLAASVSFYVIEMPMLKLKDRLSASKAGSTVRAT